MDLGSIFIILALAIAVGLFVAHPLLQETNSIRAPKSVLAGQVAKADHELSSLLAERDRILNALQDLDFDFTLGKIPAEDYPEQRSLLLKHGAEVLRHLDELQGEPQHGGAVARETVDAEDRLEAVIAARRVDGAQSQSAPSAVKLGGNGNARRGIAAAGGDDEIETLLAGRRRERKQKAVGFCPQCGGPVQVSDRFCPRCGSVLTA